METPLCGYGLWIFVCVLRLLEKERLVFQFALEPAGKVQVRLEWKKSQGAGAGTIVLCGLRCRLFVLVSSVFGSVILVCIHS